MRTAMIWGASSDSGKALLKMLIASDWTVVAVARNIDGLADYTPHVIQADFVSPYEVELSVITASQLVDHVDLWIYAAGDIAQRKTGDMSPETWWRILNVNLSGAFLATRFSLPLLAKDAHLFYFGAVSERLRLPGLGAYAAAKSGLEAFVEALGKEERQRRITIVRPTAINTHFWDNVSLKLPANALSADDVALQVLAAYQAEHKGILNISEKTKILAAD